MILEMHTLICHTQNEWICISVTPSPYLNGIYFFASAW